MNFGLCKTNYDFEIGDLSFEDNMKLVFEHKSVCPKCGVSDNDLLSEAGQSQMSEWHLKDLDLDFEIW